MKLIDVLLFVSGICLVSFGVHQTVTVGFAEAYWLYMVGLTLLLINGYRKKTR